jgi:hypothetical protein
MVSRMGISRRPLANLKPSGRSFPPVFNESRETPCYMLDLIFPFWIARGNP